MSVLAARGEHVVGFASRARDGLLALEDLPEVDHEVLLHFAYVTRERSQDQTWEAYVAANCAITSLVREAVVRHQPRVFYASSGAAERPGSLRDDPYGALKRLDEHVLRDASGGRCAVARVFNVAGPHVTKPTAFLLTDLVTQALDGGPLRVRSRRPVIRSYVDVEDVAAWAIASAGQDVVVSTAGDREVEAAELAQVIARVLGVEGQPLREFFDPSADADRYVGDRAGWAAALSAAGVVERTLEQQILRTAEAIRAPRAVR
jgi:nucleoside-diphosphate-sugar epimerase